MIRFLTTSTGALLVAAASTTALAHARVDSASPKNGSTLGVPPPEIRLQFNEPVEPTFTAVRLFGPSGREFATGRKAHVEDDKTLVLPLPTLPPGAYKAEWMSVGHDGHHVHGAIAFTVK